MSRRARNLFLTWLGLCALQLMLLGALGAASRAAVAQRGAHSPSEVQSLSLGKRVLAPEPTDRRAPTPFAPATYIRLDLPAAIVREPSGAPNRQAPTSDRVALPPARAPPTLS